MLKTNLMIRAVMLVMCAALLITAPLLAQDTCPAAESSAFTTLLEACANAPFDAVCSVEGESVALGEFVSTETAPQLIRLSGTGDAQIDLVMVGVQLAGYELGESAPVGVLEIGNRAGYNVNLRGGPGSDFDVVGTFRFDDRLMVDGQSADGQWLRIVNEDGTFAWVSVGLVAVDPAIASLPIVDANSTSGQGHVVTITADPACEDATGGLFITTGSESAQRLTLNDVPVSVTNGTLYAQFTGENLTFFALAGESAVGTGEQRTTLESGDVIVWGDTPAEPETVPPFPSITLLNALAIETDACLVTADSAVEALDQPVDGSAAAGDFEGGVTLIASEGASTDDVTWLRVDAGWLRANDVTSYGDCDALVLASATPAPGAVNVAGAGLTPDQVMMAYLNARLVADGTRMQALACASYDSQAVLQSQAFRAMRAELLNVTCTTTAQSGATATVFCGGVIQTEYNGEFRQWELGAYAMTQENGAWRVCGEAG